MLGIPAEHGDPFRSWITMALQEGITNQASLGLGHTFESSNLTP